MQHLGDITKISGYSAPIVDCIIGGSPCQDLSVAGKRAGLDGERSGLYIEQVRIVKEMRERDERNGRSGVDIRPRYMVWENVPGAFSSNKGEDFRIVLEELAKVKDPNAVVPMPDKWTNHGCIMGDGWSIAWRVLDAQFWGVPQRRRRIALVADFGGQSAPEILFVRQSVSGDTEQSESKRKATPSDASGSLGADDCIGVDIYNTALTGDKVCPLTAGGTTSTGTCPKVMLPVTFEPGIASREGGHIYEGVSGTLRANAGDNQMATAYSVENHPNDSRVGINEDGKVQALTSRMGTGGGNVPMVMQCYSKSKRAQSATDNETWVETETANTLNAFDVGDVRTTEVVVCVADHPTPKVDTKGVSFTLQSRDFKVPMCAVYALDRASFNQGKNAQFDFEVSDKGISSPIVAKGPSAVCYTIDQGGGKSSVDIREDQAPTLTTTHDGAPAVCYGFPLGFRPENVRCYEETATTLCNGTRPGFTTGVITSKTRYIVRRLTPLECERLQGYPDGWTDIGEWTDSNGKKRQTSDAARYKALGNSIALPPWKWVLKRLCACYERDATMASLFDGIGGFPYLWEQLNGKGTCLWASEIEEFPIAVTKVRIGE